MQFNIKILCQHLREIQSALTILAMLFGAAWFVAQCSLNERIDLEIAVQEAQINDAFSLLKAEAQITNRGFTRVKLRQRRFALLKVSPPDTLQLERISSFSLGGKYPKIYPTGAEPVTFYSEGWVYPGETERMTADFTVLRCVSAVIVEFAMCSRVETCLDQPVEKKAFIWDASKLHELHTYLGEEACQ